MASIEVTGKYKNKVVYGTTVLVDLTADTVTKDTLKKGATAHDASGEPITGTLTIPDQQARTVDLNMPSGNQTIIPDNGKVLSKVTVTKPTTMIPENIKKDVNIGGVVGTLENSGGVSVGETWFLHCDFDRTKEKEFRAKFTSDGKTYNSIKIGGVVTSGDIDRYEVFYDTETILTGPHGFNDTDAKRRITFADSPTGDLLTWLKASATKQPNNTAELITINAGRSHFDTGLYLYSGVTSEQINVYSLPRDLDYYVDVPNESTILLLIDKDVYSLSIDWLQEDVINNPEKFLMQDSFMANDHYYFLALFKAVNGLEI